MVNCKDLKCIVINAHTVLYTIVPYCTVLYGNAALKLKLSSKHTGRRAA